MATVYLSMGSNIGNRGKFLDSASELLKMKIHDLVSSSLYETKPWGEPNQPRFLNKCVRGETDLEPMELLSFIRQTETHCGRTPTFKWGPREIDIDILFYENLTMNEQGLQIPHPHIQERAFVLTPLVEIAGEFTHPTIKKTIKELAREIDTSDVEKFEL